MSSDNWSKSHRKERWEYEKERRKTPKGRAAHLISTWRKNDKKYNRGDCDLDSDYVVELWKKGCAYCGETDFMKLGVDRINNAKPHTKNNVVCCCESCNKHRNLKDFFEYFNECFMNSILE